ncbi:MAG: hypothetical protein M0C28_45785 [Candidatus Moduliflexus flocculans]|nr:hypothetical protein [Candidatus Moduliflexus flocculans]
MTVKERLVEYGGFIDVGILNHGFAPHLRDYDVLFEALWGKKKWADAKGTYRLRFSHCPEATILTRVPDASWKQAWADVFIDYDQWVAAGEPNGFVWGACWSMAYPGLRYIDDSVRARQWSERMGKPMHEVIIETEAFQLQLVFHDFTVTKLSDEVSIIDKIMFPIKAQDDEETG